jgi:hypothetical protein
MKTQNQNDESLHTKTINKLIKCVWGGGGKQKAKAASNSNEKVIETVHIYIETWIKYWRNLSPPLSLDDTVIKKTTKFMYLESRGTKVSSSPGLAHTEYS